MEGEINFVCDHIKIEMSLMNYYASNGEVVSMNDLNQPQTLSSQECIKAHYYLSPSPMGYFNQLGAETVGQRPVWKSYEVGKLTCTSKTSYRDTGNYSCRQPCWSPNCK